MSVRGFWTDWRKVPGRTTLCLAFAAVLLAGPVSSRAGASNTALSAKAGADASTTAGSPVRARARKPSNAVVARRLGRALKRAKSVPAKRRVLLRIANALNIGVYKPNGKPVSRGSERRQSDFVLYDFELGIIAQALKRKRGLASYEEMAAQLNALVVNPKDWSLPAADLRSVVVSVTRKAKRLPRKRLSLLPLVVREAGRARSRKADTLRKTLLGAPVFDPLQTALIYADIFSKVPRAARHRSSSSAKPAAMERAAKGDCLGIGRPNKEATRFGKFAAGFIKKVGPVVRGFTVVTDGIHGVVLAASVDFQPTTNGQVSETHYGPTGTHHESEYAGTGRELRFQVGVQVVFNLPDGLVKCGPLVGLEFPKKGPVARIPINWDSLVSGGGYRELKKHGRIVQEDKETNKNGIATLRFRPKDEVLVGVGKEEQAINTLAPTAEYLSALGSTIGFVVDKQGALHTILPWSISFHSQKARLYFDSSLKLPPASVGLVCGGVPGCSTSGQVTVRTSAQVPVEYDPDSNKVRAGKSPLNYVQSSGQVALTAPDDCGTVTVTVKPTGATLPGQLEIPSVLMDSGGERVYVYVNIPGAWAPHERYSQIASCGGHSTTTPMVTTYWYQNFSLAHEGKLFLPAPIGTLVELSREGNAFRKRYQRSKGVNLGGVLPYTVVEDTEIGLYPR